LALADKSLTGMLSKLAERLNEAVATKELAAKLKRETRAFRIAARDAKRASKAAQLTSKPRP